MSEFTPGQVERMRSTYAQRLLVKTTFHREQWEAEEHLQEWHKPKLDTELCMGTEEWCGQGKEGDVEECLTKRKVREKRRTASSISLVK